MMCHRIGLPPISTMGFGRVCVSSLSRVPRPPARMTAFTCSHRRNLLPLKRNWLQCCTESVRHCSQFAGGLVREGEAVLRDDAGAGRGGNERCGVEAGAV